MNPLKHLEALAFEAERAKHPTIPEHAIPRTKYRANDTNSLTNCIVDLVNHTGGHASRINTMGIFNQQTQRYRKSGATLGVPDIMACHGGRSIGIEVKYGRDKQSEAQERWQSKHESAGGVCFIAKTFDEFYFWWMNSILK